QMDAHAWVEVWLPPYGWLPLDPTPPGGAIAPVLHGRLWTGLRQIVDDLELVWYKHLVEYSLDQQVRLARQAQQLARALFRPGATPGGLKPYMRRIGIAAIFVGALVLLWLRLSRRGTWFRQTRR